MTLRQIEDELTHNHRDTLACFSSRNQFLLDCKVKFYVQGLEGPLEVTKVEAFETKHEIHLIHTRT